MVVADEESFAFDGMSYPSYQDMVDAKRRRNADVLARSGLLEARSALSEDDGRSRRTAASARGLKRAKAPPPAVPPRRKSSRIAGGTAPGSYVDSESGGSFVIAGGDGLAAGEKGTEEGGEGHYNRRVNDGSDLTLADAVRLTGPRWSRDGDVERAGHLANGVLPDAIEGVPIAAWGRRAGGGGGGGRGGGSPASVVDGPFANALRGRLDGLSLDDADGCVAKVTPERIYGIACHPSPDGVIVCAGDKAGHLGIWNVDRYRDGVGPASSDDGVHLFRTHGGAISTLAWNGPGTSLLSCSYDGSVRRFDVERGQVFEEVFATYNDDAKYKDKLGYGTDRGYNSWIQSMEIDNRFSDGGSSCFFLCTSEGGVMHVDARAGGGGKGKLTFDRVLSEKKINTVSLHPDGNVMATAGLTGIVQLWDVRKIPTLSSREKSKPISSQQAGGRSINSAYFSPSGRRLLTTTQSNKLEIFVDAHLSKGTMTPTRSVRHDNQTGRWLSTFMARWHPGSSDDREIFVVGSMSQPRCIEIYDHDGELLRELRGDALTAVASRCCFHPDPNRLIVVGGNSSGRVTIAR